MGLLSRGQEHRRYPLTELRADERRWILERLRAMGYSKAVRARIEKSSWSRLQRYWRCNTPMAQGGMSAGFLLYDPQEKQLLFAKRGGRLIAEDGTEMRAAGELHPHQSVFGEYRAMQRAGWQFAPQPHGVVQVLTDQWEAETYLVMELQDRAQEPSLEQVLHDRFAQITPQVAARIALEIDQKLDRLQREKGIAPYDLSLDDILLTKTLHVHRFRDYGLTNRTVARDKEGKRQFSLGNVPFTPPEHTQNARDFSEASYVYVVAAFFLAMLFPEQVLSMDRPLKPGDLPDFPWVLRGIVGRRQALVWSVLEEALRSPDKRPTRGELARSLERFMRA